MDAARRGSGNSAWQLSVVLAAALASGTGGARRVVPWVPKGIASSQFESHAAFDPWNGDLYFVRSSPAFKGWRILHSRRLAEGWSAPESPAFAGDGVEADPWFTPDGRSLYFISTRSTDGIARPDLDLWRVDRDSQGRWGTPRRLPGPLNSTGREWFPRIAPDGWLYFGSDRPGGRGKTDIWRARETRPGEWMVENLGPSINTPADEYEAAFSPDGTRMILMGGDGLYESRRTAAGWSPRRKLPSPITVNGTELGALFSPSGRSLLFARDTKGPDSGEFFVWRIEEEEWP